MRYHFHDLNGEERRDDEGVELGSVDDAKVMATRLLARLISDDPELLWRDGHHIVRCATSDGLTLFEICASVTKAPALR